MKMNTEYHGLFSSMRIGLGSTSKNKLHRKILVDWSTTLIGELF